MARYSKLWDIDPKSLQMIYDTSNTQFDILQKCGVNPSSGSHRTLKIVAEHHKIDDTTFKINRQEMFKTNSNLTKCRDYTKDFIENSTASRTSFKAYIIKNSIIEYSCKKCGNVGIHQDEKLILQLEHINGIHNDNRIENLCFLCPNCHSQTSTYSGKQNKKEKPKKLRNRKFNPSKDELKLLMDNNTFVKIGKMFGVSDNAVRKRCKILELI